MVKLIGRIQTEHLSELRAQLDAIGASIVLDLGDVSLVNLDVVQFLSTCESQGTQARTRTETSLKLNRVEQVI
jgi:hypothetical protein